MGLNNSKLYEIWINLSYKAKENIEEFYLSDELKIFTNEDIICLCKNNFYKDLFEDKILIHYVEEIYERLSLNEFYDILINGTNKLQNKMFLELINQYENSKSLLEILRKEENFSNLFKIYSLDIMNKKIQINEKFLLEFLTEDEIIYIIRNKLKNLSERTLREFVKETKNNKLYLEEIFNNIESSSYFLEILNESSNSQYFMNIKDKFQDKVYSLIYGINSSIFVNSNYKKILKMLFEECLKITTTKIENIEYIGKGTTSTVYKIGNLVFKVGNSRYVHDIPNHNRILYPIFRKKIEDINLYIEITSLTDTKNITNDDVYIVFKELMDDGIVWIDARKENLGRLLENNNSYGIFIDEDSVGYKGQNLLQRKKGELVIIDTDLIYFDNKVPWNYLSEKNIDTSFFDKMIDRYITEKNQKVKKFM